MKKFFALILIVSILLAAISSDLYANRRQPTEIEQVRFLPIVKIWVIENWETKQILSEGYRRQKIIDINYCCIDEFDDGRHLHIVDIKFHAKEYHNGALIDEGDMIQRILFKCKDYRIIDFDPLPAYKLEEVA